MFRKQLFLLLLLVPTLLFGMKTKKAAAMRRARSSMGFHITRFSPRAQPRRVHVVRAHSTIPENFSHAGPSAASSTNRDSNSSPEQPRILDSPYTVLPWPRCDSPALFGLVRQLIQRPIYRTDPDGRLRVNFDFRDVPELTQLAISCENLDEAELLNSIFSDIKLHDRGVIFKNDSPAEILGKIIRYARAKNGRCTAVLSWQNYRYIIAKNKRDWVFVNLQHQSEREQYKAGSHSKIYKSLEGVILQIDAEWKNLKTVWQRIETASNRDPFDDWEENLTTEQGLQVSYYCSSE